MRLAILIFLFVSSAQAGVVHRSFFQDNKIPNIICPYYYMDRWVSDNVWMGYWGEFHNVSLALLEVEGGSGICSTQFYDEKNSVTLVKNVQYSSENSYDIDPQTCESKGGLKVKTVQAQKAVAALGQAFEMTADLARTQMGAKKIKFISYFPTEDEVQSWMLDFDKIQEKCFDLFPEVSD